MVKRIKSSMSELAGKGKKKKKDSVQIPRYFGLMSVIPLRYMLAICIILDYGFDVAIGAWPILGDAWDIIQGALAFIMFGPLGLLAFWEFLLPLVGNMVDAFVPTMTILFFIILSISPKAKAACKDDDACEWAASSVGIGLEGKRREKGLFSIIIVAMLLLTMASSVQVEEVEGAGESWTMIVFMAGDNDLESQVDADTLEIQVASSEIDVLVLTDHWDDGDSRLWHIKNGVKTEKTPSFMPSEINTGSIGIYKSVITYADSYYPATKYAIVFWDHGLGWGGSGFDTTNIDFLENHEIRQILNHARSVFGQKVDVVGFDSCYMNQIDVVYETHLTCQIFIGSEMSEPWTGWDYDFLSEVTDATDRDTFARKVLNYYTNQYSGIHHTIAALNLTRFDINVTENFNMLFQSLKHNARTEANNIAGAIDACTTFLEVQQYYFYDLYSFAHELQLRSSNATIDLHANRLKANITDMVIQENGTLGNGLGFYFCNRASDYYQPYQTFFLSQYTSIDECQVQYLRLSDATENVPDVPVLSKSDTILTLTGDGVQYRVGSGAWKTYGLLQTLTGADLYYRSWNGIDYSQQNHSVVNGSQIKVSTDYVQQTIHFNEGWNIFAPFITSEVDFTASRLCSLLGLSDTRVAWFNGENYEIYIQGITVGEDFDLVPGIAYYVAVSEDVDLYMSGTVVEHQSISLEKGWNIVGYYANEDISASDFNRSYIHRICKIDDNGHYILYYPQLDVGTDFLIQKGDGIYIDADTTGGIDF